MISLQAPGPPLGFFSGSPDPPLVMHHTQLKVLLQAARLDERRFAAPAPAPAGTRWDSGTTLKKKE